MEAYTENTVGIWECSLAGQQITRINANTWKFKTIQIYSKKKLRMTYHWILVIVQSIPNCNPGWFCVSPHSFACHINKKF